MLSYTKYQYKNPQHFPLSVKFWISWERLFIWQIPVKDVKNIFCKTPVEHEIFKELKKIKIISYQTGRELVVMHVGADRLPVDPAQPTDTSPPPLLLNKAQF
jgi:hypothetical protein